MAAAGYTALVVDCEDAVRYRSHPELARSYTAPMRDLVTLARRAHQHGLDVVPKINFSQSHWHFHNHWFRPHHLLFDNAEYWRRAFRIIDELIRVCGRGDTSMSGWMRTTSGPRSSTSVRSGRSETGCVAAG